VAETTTTDVARLRAYRRAQYGVVTTRAEPFAHGTAFFHPGHPSKWDVNLLIVDDATGLSAEELIAEAERLQAPAGLRHRKIECLQGGDDLVSDFGAAGWTTDRLVVMVLDPDADHRGDTPARVREVDFEAVRGLNEQWYLEGMSAPEAGDLVESDGDAARMRPTRFFLAEREGEAAAYCMLLGDEGIGEVESVYASKTHRGAGLASAVVRAAIAASQERGDDLITIAADAADWPQHLYERLGFTTVDRRRSFTRKPR
jgi:ribosomal protein S18 acetylase RimI-like enzyme